MERKQLTVISGRLLSLLVSENREREALMHNRGTKRLEQGVTEGFS